MPNSNMEKIVSLLLLLHEELHSLMSHLTSFSFLPSRLRDSKLSCHPLLDSSLICLFKSVWRIAVPSVGPFVLIAACFFFLLNTNMSRNPQQFFASVDGLQLLGKPLLQISGPV